MTNVDLLAHEPTIPLYRTWWGFWLTESDVGLILLILATMGLVVHIIGNFCDPS